MSESGIHTRRDVERLETAGVSAILVGESLMLLPISGWPLGSLGQAPDTGSVAENVLDSPEDLLAFLVLNHLLGKTACGEQRRRSKDASAMAAMRKGPVAPQTIAIPPRQLKPNSFSLSIYGDPAAEIDDLLPSIRDHGVLVALVVAPGPEPGTWEIISGHRRLACAQALGFTEVSCEVRSLPEGATRRRSILEYNRQRRKTFSQLMREADAIEELWAAEANLRRLA